VLRRVKLPLYQAFADLINLLRTVTEGRDVVLHGLYPPATIFPSPAVSGRFYMHPLLFHPVHHHAQLRGALGDATFNDYLVILAICLAIASLTAI